ncbi:hypothetical protein Ahy_B04g073080 isoform A [Arachis hypogaea]|uniref:NADH:quinone oxidoreductase/Mrp antiporter transmembrane domain-containing protein n=1 Tax=Arachis hypogaea TaxID=3818 RepID=A0A444ZPV1_ARAHY|nr:hypothetical protein Ahy_B04g073080 isoform A [Arachis hypogaea]
MELLLHAHSIFFPGSIQIIYAASTSLAQRNLKKRIAYSSVSHISFIIIGIDGFIRFIGAALFFLAGTGYDRLHLFYLDQMGGMAFPMAKIFTVFSILSMASLALPSISESARIIYFDFYPYTHNWYWYLSRFYFLILS